MTSMIMGDGAYKPLSHGRVCPSSDYTIHRLASKNVVLLTLAQNNTVIYASFWRGVES